MPKLCFVLPLSRPLAYRFHTQTISCPSSNLILVFFGWFSHSHLMQYARVPKPLSYVSLSPVMSLGATSSCTRRHFLFSSSLHLSVFVDFNNRQVSFSSPQRRLTPLNYQIPNLRPAMLLLSFTLQQPVYTDLPQQSSSTLLLLFPHST